MHISDTQLCLHHLIVQNQWNFDRVHTMVPKEIKARFSSVIPRLSPNDVDTWTWNNTDEGRYTVREGYRRLRDRVPTPDTGHSWTWVSKLSLRKCVFSFAYVCMMLCLLTILAFATTWLPLKLVLGALPLGKMVFTACVTPRTPRNFGVS